MLQRFTRHVTAIAGLMVVMTAAASGSASAQPFQRQPYQEWQFETKRPQRGYEGFPAPGVYCSYRREPIRQCNTDRQGRERCRVVRWRLIQMCS